MVRVGFEQSSQKNCLRQRKKLGFQDIRGVAAGAQQQYDSLKQTSRHPKRQTSKVSALTFQSKYGQHVLRRGFNNSINGSVSYRDQQSRPSLNLESEFEPSMANFLQTPISLTKKHSPNTARSIGDKTPVSVFDMQSIQNKIPEDR